jgi:hypothetical protein
MNRGIPKYEEGEISRDINCYGLFLLGFPSNNLILLLMNFMSGNKLMNFMDSKPEGAMSSTCLTAISNL